MLGRAAGTSAATHTSGPSVPEHRKLGRTYPRSTTLDANSPRNSDAVRKAPAASTSGSLRNGDNRDGASRMASSGSHHADGATYQDTYVDRAQRSSSEPAALSPSARLPLENGPVNPTLEDSDDRNVDPIVTATRTRRVSRSALEAREQDTGPLEQTYIEEPSLPPPPPSRPTPRRYGKHRKRSGPTTPAADHGDSGVESNTSREALVDTAPRPSTNGVTLSKGKKRKVGGKTPPPKFSAASDASSSPVAEDPEDYSYRPPLLSSTRRAKVRNGSKQSAGPPIKRRKLTGAGSSRTPAISITSAITSVPSSSGGAGVRVFAWWGPSRTYFPGRIVGSEGSKVRVRFLDGDHAVLPIDKLRLCVLRKGDLMIPAAKIDGVTYPEVEVEEHWEGHPALIKVAVRGKPVGELPIEKLIIRQAVINQTFCDRVVDPKLLGREAGQTVSYRRTASPLKKKSSSTVFRDKIILITTAASKDKSSTGLIALTERITTNGGKVLDDWTKLFNIPDDAFGSGLKTTAAPFLLVQGDKMIMKPKLMAALATGIPCLDTAFVEAAIQRVSVWATETC